MGITAVCDVVSLSGAAIIGAVCAMAMTGSVSLLLAALSVQAASYSIREHGVAPDFPFEIQAAAPCLVYAQQF